MSRKLLVILWVLALVVLSGLTWWNHDRQPRWHDPYGRQAGMGSPGYGPQYGAGPGTSAPYPALPPGAAGLSPEQAASIATIQRDLARQEDELARRLRDEQARLQALYLSDSPDTRAMGEAYARITELQRQAIVARIEAENRIAALLADGRG